MLCDELYMPEMYTNDEEFQKVSESTEDYMHMVLTTLIQNYHELCGKSTVQQSLVNQYDRNMDYLTRHLHTAEKLNEYYSQWQKTSDNFSTRVRREIRQVLINSFGIVLHGIFPDHLWKYHQRNIELKRYLAYLVEKIV